MRQLPAVCILGLVVANCAYKDAQIERDNSIENLRLVSMQAVASMASETGSRYTEASEQDIIRTALDQVRDLLKDPDSARFKDVRIVNYQNAKLVCGSVNAKNSYGGYVGFEPFVAGVDDAILYRRSSTRSPDIERAANAGLMAAC